MRKAIDVFDNDYETLLMRAGEPNKIAFVVRELITLSDACAADIKKQAAFCQPSLDDAMPSTH
ncbi:hypothetical protein ES703_53464 [subsurface metagenome]